MADGMFDLGITGRDWVEETGADVVTIGELAYSKNSTAPGPRRALCRSGLDRAAMSDLPQGCQSLDRVPRADPARASRRPASRRTSGSPTAPPRRRSPRSPTQ